MYLIWVMLLGLIASYGLCAALVRFAEGVIQPRGSELAAPAARSSNPVSKPTLPG